MPLGKYYCDYCDKQFQDTPAARKRHLQGLHHQRAKALWYRSHSIPVADPNQMIDVDVEALGRKGLCNRFLRTGSCPYGDSCQYHHPRQNIQYPNSQGTAVTNLMRDIQSGSQPVGGTSLKVSDSLGVSLGNLPPSLKPPPEGGYSQLPFIDWG